MLDFLKALVRSRADVQRERLHAYLDNALPTEERRQFEQALADDSALQAALDDLRLLKMNLSRLPRVRAPRSFALNATVHGRAAVHGRHRPKTAARLYPIMQGAVALTAFFLVLAVVVDLSTGRAARETAVMTAADSPMESEAVALMEAAPSPAESRMMTAPEMTTTIEAKAEEGEMSSGAMFFEETAEVVVESERLVEEDAALTQSAADQPHGGVDSEAPPPIAPAPSAMSTALPEPASEPEAALELTPLPTLDQPSAATPGRSLWQTAQIILGAILAVTLTLTLYLRRRL